MKRLLLVIAAVLTAAISASAQDWAKARLDQSPRHLEWVTVKHDGREVGCYVGYPEVKNKATAVIIIHEIYGLSDWTRSMVDELAEAGYVAIAPDLLWGTGAKGGGTAELNSTEIGQKIRTLPADQITADLNATAEYIAKQPGCNGKVAVAGFCWGGGQTFRYAANNANLKAAFVFYGQGPTPEEMARIKSPVYGFYAGNDPRITAAVPQVTEQMKAAAKTYDPVVYEGSGHGFMRAGDAPEPKKPEVKGDKDADAKASSDYERALVAYKPNKKARDESWKRVKQILGKI